MRKILLILTSVFTLLIYTACSENEKVFFEKAEQVTQSNRDSLVYYLKLIKHPEKLPSDQRAKFGLMHAKSLPQDEASILYLDYSLDYYISTKDTTAIIDVYTTKSFCYRDSLARKMEYLNLAKDLALKAKHEKWLTSIYMYFAQSYEQQKNYSAALDNYLMANGYVPRDDYYFGLIQWHLARLYKKNGQKDKSIECLMNVVENASIYSPENLSSTYKNLSDIYLESGDYKKALEYINLSIRHRTNIKELPSYNLAKAIVFINTQEQDSARLYLTNAIESPNPYISNRALGYLSDLDMKINQFDRAYFTRINEDDNTKSLESSEDRYTLKQKYMEEKLKNENNQLKIEKQKQDYYFLVVIIVLFIAFVLVYIYYLHKQKQQAKARHLHEEQLLREKALLQESQNMLLKRDNELALLEQKAAILRASLFKKMSLSKKLPSLGEDMLKDVDNRKISLTEDDLIELRKTVDAAYGDFSNKFAEAYPELSQDDIVFCCLIKIQVDMQDLSDIYCISKAGITKRKMRIKKDKLKIDSDISLDNFIQQF